MVTHDVATMVSDDVGQDFGTSCGDAVMMLVCSPRCPVLPSWCGSTGVMVSGLAIVVRECLVWSAIAVREYLCMDHRSTGVRGDGVGLVHSC